MCIYFCKLGSGKYEFNQDVSPSPHSLLWQVALRRLTSGLIRLQIAGGRERERERESEGEREREGGGREEEEDV